MKPGKLGLRCMALLMILMGVLLGGCQKTETAVNPAQSREGAADTLTVGCEMGQGIFNPLYYASAYDGYVVGMIFEPLVDLDEEGEAYGVLAENWDVSGDMCTYTVHLKSGLVFSDGQPVTAYDVENTYLALADPSYDGRYSTYAANLLGYEAYVSGAADTLEGLRVIDDATVSFTFTEALRTNLEMLRFPILPKDVYAFDRGDTAALGGLNETPVGSGPYRLEAYEPGQFVKLTKNEQHRDAGEYDIANVVLKAVDSSTALTELLAGDVDLLPGVEGAEIRAQAEESGFAECVDYPESGFSFLEFNCSADSVCGDARVRQALSYAFDAQTAVKACFEDPQTGYTPAQTVPIPMSPVSWAYTDSLLGKINPYDYDPQMACELLDEAGWTLNEETGYREKDGQILEIKFPAMTDRPVLDTLIPLLLDWWGAALNAKVTVEYMDYASVLDYVVLNSDANTDRWDVFFLSMAPDSYDPDSLYTWFSSDFIGNYMNNLSRYDNPEADRLLEEGRRIADHDQAAAVYEQLYLVLNEDQPVQILWSAVCCDVLNTRFTGMQTGPIHNWVSELKDLTFAQ